MRNSVYIIAILLGISWTAIIFLYQNFIEIRRFMANMMKFTNRVRNRDFTARMDIPKSRYTYRIAKNLNRMASMIERYFNEVQNKSDQLDAIIKSVTNGILVVDINKRIYLINEEAKKLLGCDTKETTEGELVADVIKEDRLRDFLVYNIGTNHSITNEVKVSSGRIYKVKVDPIKMQDIDNLSISTVVNIEDITDRIRLENMRKDFAANVSHELKTPLTSISGFVETLKNKDEDISPDMRRRFLDIIDNESRRLSMLINDILLISSIEGHIEVSKEEISIREITQNVLDLLEDKARKYEVDLDVNYSSRYDTFVTNGGYFKDLLINLVSNGIKYNKPKGRVSISYRDDKDKLIIEVSDNGIGIGHDDIDRIFERFYRVTKSRSKSIDGTGLGLAIVKHIVISLDGSIDIESDLGVGTKFTISLPRK